MKIIWIILVILILCSICISCFTIREGGDTSMLPDNSVIVIDTSESLRKHLRLMHYIATRNENEVDINDKTKVTLCYKINKLYSYLDPIKYLIDNKTEEELMEAYGAKKQPQIMGQPVGQPPPQPIIGCNYDYYTFIMLGVYMKMLKPYVDLKIWEQTINKKNNTVVISKCTETNPQTVQMLACARSVLRDLIAILEYFQYQTDTSHLIRYGDDDTGTGNVPKASMEYVLSKNKEESIVPPADTIAPPDTGAADVGAADAADAGAAADE